MADDAIVFALANPTPEVHPEVAHRHARVVATGRSDFPNQINNVLAFPGIFRGAFDVHATAITEGMKLAAAAGARRPGRRRPRRGPHRPLAVRPARRPRRRRCRRRGRPRRRRRPHADPAVAATSARCSRVEPARIPRCPGSRRLPPGESGAICHFGVARVGHVRRLRRPSRPTTRWRRWWWGSGPIPTSRTAGRRSTRQGRVAQPPRPVVAARRRAARGAAADDPGLRRRRPRRGRQRGRRPRRDQRPGAGAATRPSTRSGRCSPSATRAPSPTRSPCRARNVVPKPASLSLRGGGLPADGLADGVPDALHPGRAASPATPCSCRAPAAASRPR